MSFNPYTDRDFLGDTAQDIIDMLKQIAATLQTIADELKKRRRVKKG